MSLGAVTPMLPTPMARIEWIPAGDGGVRAPDREETQNEHSRPMPVNDGDPERACGNQRRESQAAPH